MIKVWVLIMIVEGYDNYRVPPVQITQEFNSLESCQAAMKSIARQVHEVHQSGCYVK